MMREIKYRAWNKQKEIMNYDNEDDTEDYWDGIYTSDIGMVNRLLNIPDKDDHYSISSFRHKYEVMQYTGLKDKNGVDIYEGDVVRCDRRFGRRALEVFQARTGEWRAEHYRGGQVLAFCCEECEVIGNIYEHPHLLKERVE